MALKNIREGKYSKIVAIYLAMQLLLQASGSFSAYALTSGPSLPDFNAFTPIGTSDMVDLSSGDFNYNLPLLDVGGYPVNLSYSSGVNMSQEASWVGLGWNLSVGQINRQLRGLPDDFKGDEMIYEDHLKPNITVGTTFNISGATFGFDIPLTFGLGVQYNNYSGITFQPSYGISFDLAKTVNVGFDFSSSIDEGASISPSVSLLDKNKSTKNSALSLSAGLGSRKGLESISISSPALNSAINSKLSKSGSGYGLKPSGTISLNSTYNYTPTKRKSMLFTNFTFEAKFGGEVIGAEGDWSIAGYASTQSMMNKLKKEKAFGYDFTHDRDNNTISSFLNEGVLDFNRENENTVNQNTIALPTTSYTYDLYSIQGQGIGGMFRPFRSQVSYVFNDYVADLSVGASGGAEFESGNLVKGGYNISVSPTVSWTGKWFLKNNSLSGLNENKKDNNSHLYEPVYFKSVGEVKIEEDVVYKSKLNGVSPMRIQLGGGNFDRFTLPNYIVKEKVGSSGVTYKSSSFASKIKRTKRVLTNQSIQKVKASESDNKFIFRNPNAKDHHTAGIKVLKEDGSLYVFGETAYNTKKIEASFDVSGKTPDLATQTVTYNGSVYGNDNGNSDEFVNKVTTPAYAHTYLISSILSEDYEDIDDNGPSDNDLGGYTKFVYTSSKDGKEYMPNYKWRTPFGKNKALYNEGLKTNPNDQKGSYIYGEKEVKYLKRIETKTHIAFFDLKERTDSYEVEGEHGGKGSNAFMQLSSIRLYSKKELQKDSNGLIQDPGINGAIAPIKTVHLKYSEKLCNGIESGNSGKLTLEKVYFTYKNSSMGMYTPYKFTYTENTNYNAKAHDIWGNYKENNGVLNTTEFPFVEQNKTQADLNSKKWTLQKIQLPSGGEITVETESDDYKHVQNKKAMQMFKVVGTGSSAVSDNYTNNKLYESNRNHNKFLYVKIENSDANITKDEFIKKYLSENLDEPIYFKFLLNMNAHSSDYVSGYFKIDKAYIDQIKVNNNAIVAIPVQFVKKDGGLTSNQEVNPISKAGWGFGRTYLNREVYSIGGDSNNTDAESIILDLVGSFGMITEIFRGPNGFLQNKGCAQKFDNQKSWIRLENPIGRKYGGGLRVKNIKLSDRWSVMIQANANDPAYENVYGQQYNYDLEDGTSSGVAAFEPNDSPENALIRPFFKDNDERKYADRIAAPKENNYVEKPFGKSFFPSEKITYSRVTVSNILQNQEVMTKRRTGKVITEFYTTKDFPTLVDYTNIDLHYDKNKNPLLNFLKVKTTKHLTASQGFSIVTNDMDGKMKSTSVYAEGQNFPISGEKYYYNTKGSELVNDFKTIDSQGNISTRELGVDYDVVNDFNEAYSKSITAGANVNFTTVFFPIPFIPFTIPLFIPTVFPKYANHTNLLRTASTTKVVNKTGILVKKEVFDAGSSVETENLAWDAQNGQVLLNKVNNEFNDIYYSFNYPAYWYYSQMGMASSNIGIVGSLKQVGNTNKFELINADLSHDNYFKLGDELRLSNGLKAWVVAVDATTISLLDRKGAPYDYDQKLSFKIERSGNKNLQQQNMASVTLMKNPLKEVNGNNKTKLDNSSFVYTDVNTTTNKVLNGSAIEYSDDWASQCENYLPNEKGYLFKVIDNNNKYSEKVNPYLYNLKGEWRAVKSYAYLTGRNNFVTSNIRKAGFYDQFSPFYQLNKDKWEINRNKWTYSSEITKFNPYGVEIENKDALNRYSSAQFGYQYTLPLAIASNAKYQEMGFDGFEDYESNTQASIGKPHFGFSQSLEVNKAVVNTKQAHSGNNSLEVGPKKKAIFNRKINGCKEKCTFKGINIPEKIDLNCANNTVLNIPLITSEPGATFIWEMSTIENISGAKAGQGNVINQELTVLNPIKNAKVVYKVTPVLEGCYGDTYTITVTKDGSYKLPSVITDARQSLSIQSGERFGYTFTTTVPDATIYWDPIPNNLITGATSGSNFGSASISQVLTLVPNEKNAQIQFYEVYVKKGSCLSEKLKIGVVVNPVTTTGGTGFVNPKDNVIIHNPNTNSPSNSVGSGSTTSAGNSINNSVINNPKTNAPVNSGTSTTGSVKNNTNVIQK